MPIAGSNVGRASPYAIMMYFITHFEAVNNGKESENVLLSNSASCVRAGLTVTVSAASVFGTVLSFAPLPCWLRSSQPNLWQIGPIRNCISRTGKQQRRERNVGRVFTREPEAVIDGPLSRSQSGAGRMAQNKGARGGTGGCDCWGLRSKGVCVLGVGLQPRLGQCNRGDGRRKYILIFI